MSGRLGAFAERFVRRKPTVFLAYGLTVSILDAAMLFGAASREGVLHIPEGVGFLANYGIFSTLLGNAVLPFLACKYYRAVRSIWTSKAVVNSKPVERALASLDADIALRGRTRFVIYGFVVVGGLAWLSNVASHLSGSYRARWGYEVFDSPEHQLTFLASRFHNLVTWIFIMPFVAYVVVITSHQLWRMVSRAVREDALKYDLLNPDQRGGFGFVDRAALAFNILALVVYCQISLHIGTFRMNLDHVISYVLATVLVVSINLMFFGGLYSAVRDLELEALNNLKEKVFTNDVLSLEILKYCYAQRPSALTVLNFLINPGAVVTSGVVKLWPFLRALVN